MIDSFFTVSSARKMSILTNIILWIGFFCFVFWWLKRTNRNKKFYNRLPGPPTIPLFGNALDLKSTKGEYRNIPWTEQISLRCVNKHV
jgi:hypothetical protein